MNENLDKLFNAAPANEDEKGNWKFFSKVGGCDENGRPRILKVIKETRRNRKAQKKDEKK